MRILVPTDFSTFSFNAIDFAKKIADQEPSEIFLLHVIEIPSAQFTSSGQSIEDQMNEKYMLDLSQKVKNQMSEITKLDDRIKPVVRFGDPYKVITRTLENENIDMLIIGESGIGDDTDFFIGSLADKLVRSSILPVITVNEIADLPFNSILYATDLEEEHKDLITLIKRLQSIFECAIHIVKINTRANYTNEIDTMVELHRLKDKYDIQNCNLSTYSHEDEEYGIVYFADKVGAGMIALGVNSKSRFRQVINGGSLAEEVKDHTRRPVLTLRF